jgi:hypothetical protein
MGDPLEPEILEGDKDGNATLLPSESTAIAIRGPLAIDVPARLEEWKQYQELTKQLLDPSDYQSIGKKKFKKKSAWRKYARAFSLSELIPMKADGAPDIDAVVQVVMRAQDGYPLVTRAFSVVEGPGGRRGTGYHEVHVKEKCCPAQCPRAKWNDHTCCAADCDGRVHWSHPGDGPATAHTRAKNRAISDLIGAGEVSAEEMDTAPPPQRQAPQQAEAPKERKPASEKLADCLLRGFKLLSDNDPRRPSLDALVQEFTTWTPPGESQAKCARNLDQLLRSGVWAGKTWNSLRARLVEVLGEEAIAGLFPHGGK